MNKDFQGPLYCLKKPVHSPAEKNAGWAIYGEGKGTQTKTEREGWLQWGDATNPAAILGNSLNYTRPKQIPRIIYPNKEFSILDFTVCSLHIMLT